MNFIDVNVMAFSFLEESVIKDFACILKYIFIFLNAILNWMVSILFLIHVYLPRTS